MLVLELYALTVVCAFATAFLLTRSSGSFLRDSRYNPFSIEVGEEEGEKKEKEKARAKEKGEREKGERKGKGRGKGVWWRSSLCVDGLLRKPNREIYVIFYFSVSVYSVFVCVRVVCVCGMCWCGMVCGICV